MEFYLLVNLKVNLHCKQQADIAHTFPYLGSQEELGRAGCALLLLFALLAEWGNGFANKYRDCIPKWDELGPCLEIIKTRTGMSKSK